MNKNTHNGFEIDMHHPGRYADPSVPPTKEMLEHALAWMDGLPEYGDACQAIRDELSTRSFQINRRRYTP